LDWVLMQLGAQGDITSLIATLLWLLFFAIFFFYPSFSQRIQLSHMLRDLERKLGRLKQIRDDVRSRTLQVLGGYSERKDLDKELDRLVNSFMIPPESMDPYGVVYKLEHIAVTWEDSFEDMVRELCPKADRERAKTLTNLVEVTRGVDLIYRIVRHFYLMGKKTNNIYLVLQLQMLMPQIMEIAEAYRQASYAFSEGQPIGDGVGVLAVAKLVKDAEKKTYEIAKDTVVHELVFEGRRLLAVRAAGPGGAVGRPGEGVKRLVEAENGRVGAIITVDAGLKLEGEETGKIVEGIGVAIGGIGIDKYKIEEIAKENRIPLYAFVIYESIAEAITPMKESIAKAADKVLEKIKAIIREKVKEGETVIVAGIGNTVGIGMT